MSKLITVAIIGSRKFTDRSMLHDRCGFILANKTKDHLVFWNTDMLVISGGAKGADTLAKGFAEHHRLPFKAYLPDFEALGTPYNVGDYFKRNTDIAHACDIMIGFLVRDPIGNKGSKHAISTAIQFQKEVHIFWQD